MNIINSKLGFEKKKFWESYLSDNKDFPAMPFYLGTKIEKKLSDPKKRIEIEINDTLTEKIRKVSSGSDFLKFVILASVLQTCIHKYTNQNETLLGTPLLQKEEKKLEKEYTLPLITDFKEINNFKDVLDIVKKGLASIYVNQEYPLEHLTSTISSHNNEKVVFDFSIMFEELHHASVDTNNIEMVFSDNEEFLTGCIYYHEDLYIQGSVNEFKEIFLDILSQVLGNLDIEIKDIKFPFLTYTNEHKVSNKESDNDIIINILLKHESVTAAKILIEKGEISAYIIGAPNKFRSTHILMKYLKENLSNKLIPHEIKWVESLPDSVEQHFEDNEKRVSGEDVVPFTEAERIVQAVWADVLGVDSIQLEDDFFDIGGDSISSMQVYFKLKELGFGVSPQDIIATPYIKDIAKKSNTSVIQYADQNTISGEVNLTPSQLWFFEKNTRNINYYNNLVSVELQKKIKTSNAKLAVDALIKHHDVLRTRFEKIKGVWEQHIDLNFEKETFTHYDISEVPKVKQNITIDSILQENHNKIDIINGPMVRFIQIFRGDDQLDCLIIIGHRLITDGMSLEILLEDFLRVIEQLDKNERIILPVKTTSFKSWSISLNKYMETDQFKRNSLYWDKKIDDSYITVPEDKHSTQESTEKDTVILVEVLNRELTNELEIFASQYLKVGMRDIVFSAFLKTINQWTNSREVLIETGGHGRESIFKDTDLSRTVGWFTTNYPVLLSMPDDSNDILSVIQSIKKELNDIPLNGFDYSVLRYKLNQTGEIFTVNPLIGLDYQGRFNNSVKENSKYVITELSKVSERDLTNQRIYIFDISSWIEDGQFTLRWSFNENQYEVSTVKKLMESFFDNLKNMIVLNKK